MAIRTNEPEGGGPAVLYALAPLMTDAGDPGTGSAGGLEVAAPHPVFEGYVEDVANRRLLAAARQKGWRYLVFRNGKLLASANVDRVKGRTKFTRYSIGPFVGSTLTAIELAERFTEVETTDFELRLLDVPGLALRALWLHAENREILVPLDPAPRTLTSFRTYTEDALTEALRPAAEKLLAHTGEDEELPLAMA